MMDDSSIEESRPVFHKKARESDGSSTRRSSKFNNTTAETQPKRLADHLMKQFEERSSKDNDITYKVVKREGYADRLHLRDQSLRLVCRILRACYLNPHQILVLPTETAQYMFLVMEGRLCSVDQADLTELKKKVKRKRLYVEDIQLRSSQELAEGDVLQCSSEKWTNVVFAQKQTWLLAVSIEEYRKMVGKQIDPQLQHAMRSNSLFAEVSSILTEFTKKQINDLLSSSTVGEHTSGYYVYRLGQQPTEVFFLLEGTVHLSCMDKQDVENHRHPLNISILNDACVFGEAECLQDCKRTQNAIVTSSLAKIMRIKIESIWEVVYNRGENLESFKQKMFQEYAMVKQKWRENKLKQLIKFNSIQTQNSSKCSSAHNSQPTMQFSKLVLGKYLHNSREIAGKIKNTRTIIEMRGKYLEQSLPITFSNPLFQRGDFPELDTSLRRYENEERRIKKKLILPRI